jgi:two-component system chemotaxis response regulator CheB
MPDKIKVLVVDDSTLVRKVIADILSGDPDIEVVGTANNGKTAIFKSQTLKPDVITLDIEMPIMDGLEALREIIRTDPKPVIMMSVLTQHGAEATFKALEYGAVDFIPKPSTSLKLSVEEISDLLIKKVKSVYKSKVKLHHEEPPAPASREESKAEKPRESREERASAEELKAVETSDRVVAIGTSTGGPSALLQIFRSLPKGFPSPVSSYSTCPRDSRAPSPNGWTETRPEGEGGGERRPHRAGMRLYRPRSFAHERGGVRERPDRSRVPGEKVTGHRPSIDVLFDSIAGTYGKSAIAVIMTGMEGTGPRAS